MACFFDRGEDTCYVRVALFPAMPRHPAVHFAAPTPRPNLHRTAITLPMYDLALPFGLPTPAPLDFFETFYILPFPIRPGLFNIWVNGSLSFMEWPAAASPPSPGRIVHVPAWRRL